MQGHQGGVQAEGQGRQVEVVEHDAGVMVQAVGGAEVQAQRAAADLLQGAQVLRPAEEQPGERTGEQTGERTAEGTGGDRGGQRRGQGRPESNISLFGIQILIL